MRILAFETSCDDTAVAIVDDGRQVLANVRHTQVEHAQWGGVVPELAARLHAEAWPAVLKEAFAQAQCEWDDIDAIAVTQGPGLSTSLLTGTTAASFLALLKDKPLLPVHHLWGHLLSPLLDRPEVEPTFPVLVLTLSGGHTQLVVLHSYTELTVLGHTLDDAAGEAFDKTAKMLGLGYPGGPIISRLAEKGDATRYPLPTILLDKESLNFSFSGLKSAVYRHVEQWKSKNGPKISAEFQADIAASFQATVVRTCVKKVERALAQHPEVHALWLVGGVSANTQLREALSTLSRERKLRFLTPAKLSYCTDNAAMIATAAYYHAPNPLSAPQHIEPKPRYPLTCVSA